MPPVAAAIRKFEPGSRIPNRCALRWWRGEDSNLRRLSQQIYSLPRLTASVPLQFVKSLNNKKMRAGAPFIRVAANFSAHSIREPKVPAIGCECRMSDCCNFRSASPIYLFRIASQCRDTFAARTLPPFTFVFPYDCAPDLELAMGLEPATC